jgi:hypothetical protein
MSFFMCRYLSLVDRQMSKWHSPDVRAMNQEAPIDGGR